MTQRTILPAGNISVYRRLVFVCAIATALLSTAPVARAAEPERCQGLARRFEIAKPQITAIEVSLTLFSAVDANCVDLATKLLDQGASVDARDRLGARPLSHAARSGHLRMVDLLLARGAPIDARNLAGSTALYFAADTGKPPIVYAAAGARFEIVKRLLARNTDVNARYCNDLTLLMWASGPDEGVPEAQAIEVVTYLLETGAHVDDRDDRGRTALMIAAEGGHAEIAGLLLARGADPSLKDKAGKRAADLTVLSSLRERLTAP